MAYGKSGNFVVDERFPPARPGVRCVSTSDLVFYGHVGESDSFGLESKGAEYVCGGVERDIGVDDFCWVLVVFCSMVR